MQSTKELLRKLSEVSPLFRLDRSVNIPWSCGEVKDADYLHAFQKIVMPIAHEFAPDFVLGECRGW